MTEVVFKRAFQVEPIPAPAPVQKLALIVSKGTLDMAYPGLMLADAARASGMEALVFFTFWGLDLITEKEVDRLHVSTGGHPPLHVPAMLGGLPGMETLATARMKHEMGRLGMPSARELLQILDENGVELYACGLAMSMFKRGPKDLVPQVKDLLTTARFLEKAAGGQVIFI